MGLGIVHDPADFDPKRRILTTVKISYFKTNGTHYRTVDYEYKVSAKRRLQSITAHLRGHANDDSAASGLPGLNGNYWQGPILIQLDDEMFIVFPLDRSDCDSSACAESFA